MKKKAEKGVGKIVEEFVASLPPEPAPSAEEATSEGEDQCLEREEDELSLMGDQTQRELEEESRNFPNEDEIFERGKALSAWLPSFGGKSCEAPMFALTWGHCINPMLFLGVP